MNPQPLIVVRDVEASSVWYQAVLGCQSGHGGPEYERLLVDGRIILQLHHADVHGHLYLGHPTAEPNGLVLWFQTPYFDAAMQRIRDHGAEVLEGPQVNANANHREIWLRDLDGYTVVLAGSPGDLGSLGADG